MFGVGARAEVLRHLLFYPATWATVSQLAKVTAYTKRNLADECEALEQAGVLTQRLDGNRFYYRLAKPKALADFVGDLPLVRPIWKPLVDVVATLLDFSENIESISSDSRVVEATRAVRAMRDDLRTLGIDPPLRVRGENYWERFQDWSASLLGDLASGNWPADKPENDQVLATRTLGFAGVS